LADKASQQILTALGRAAANPAGVPLHSRTGVAGLFGGAAAGKLAAQRCKEEGYLQTLHTEARGKTTVEFCALTEKGMAYLLSQISPKQALQDFVRAVEARQAQAKGLLHSAQQMQATLDALKTTAERVLHHVRQTHAIGPTASANGTHASKPNLLPSLAEWQESGTSEDCPLPTLFRHAQKSAAHLTIGQFHDTLRCLHDQKQVYLHPWTGPLYAIPEPPYALLIGHEIAYYASLRQRMKEEG
jgi:hypothetical protein